MDLPFEASRDRLVVRIQRPPAPQNNTHMLVFTVGNDNHSAKNDFKARPVQTMWIYRHTKNCYRAYSKKNNNLVTQQYSIGVVSLGCVRAR